jgi:hypothetical protein
VSASSFPSICVAPNNCWRRNSRFFQVTLRASQFLINNDSGDYLCPVCGLAGYFAGQHFDDDIGGVIGTGICPCCFYEPGFDDDPLASGEAKDTIHASILSYRANWIASGMPWHGTNQHPPDGWCARVQLEQLFRPAPFLVS